MEEDIVLLLVSSRQIKSRIDKQHLMDQGFRIVECAETANIKSLCLNSSIDVIIVEPPEKDGALFIANSSFPENSPLLWLGPEKPELFNSTALPGMVIFSSPSPNQNQISSHLRSLIKSLGLYKTIKDKDTQLKELTKKFTQHQQSIQEHSHFLDVLATRDGLTGLYNRRHLNTILPKEFNKCVEKITDLTMLIIDIDYFNEINKAGGVSYGDFVLNDFAARLTSAVQPKGISFRYSGEIFVALFPETTLEETFNMADALRNKLKQKSFKRFSEKRNITFSAGLVSLCQHQPDDPDELVTMAEKALFVAKSEGRDRIIIYEPVKLADSSQQNLVLLQEKLSKILDKTRISAIDSLQLLAKDLAGEKNRYHIKNVRLYVELLGKHMQLPVPIVQTFKNAITLHTSIRFLLHNEMINKEGPFTQDDRKIMNDFPFKLAEITKMFEYFSNERAVLLYHNERYDGTGYPEGLKGDEIPLGARIFCLVDALAAMNADRPHRDKLGPEQIVSELTLDAGHQFDPSLVVKVLELIKDQQMFKVKNKIIDQSIAKIYKLFPDIIL